MTGWGTTNRVTGTLAAGLGGLVSLVYGVRPVAAHTGHASHDSPLVVPATVLLASVLVATAGIYLLWRDDVADHWGQAGVGIGVLGVLVGLGLLLV